MLVYDVMQNIVMSDGRRYSEVYRPILACAQIIDSETLLISTGKIGYRHYIDFNKEDNVDVYYVD